VVDDGSGDGTDEVARRAGFPCLKHPCNLGYGGAVQTGLRYACSGRYARVVLLDGDGQHDPGEVPGLLEALDATGADLVIGSRFLGPAGYRPPLLRRAGMAFFSAVARVLTGRRIRDVTSGFQAFTGRAAAFLAEEYPLDYPDAETVVLLIRSGFRVVEHPARIRPRLRGTSMHAGLRSLYYPFRALLGVIVVLLRTPRRPRRSS
jgi:glycosyltransferase involved in cell wall biosynthesis